MPLGDARNPAGCREPDGSWGAVLTGVILAIFDLILSGGVCNELSPGAGILDATESAQPGTSSGDFSPAWHQRSRTKKRVPTKPSAPKFKR